MFSAGGIWGVGGGGVVVPPAWVSSSFGSEGGGAGASATYPSNLSGDQFMLHIGAIGNTVVPTTPSGWTLRDGPDTHGSGATSIKSWWYLRDTRSTGGESGTVSVADIVSVAHRAAIHVFRGVSMSLSVIDATKADADDDSSIVTGPTIVPAGLGRLGVCLVVLNAATTMSAFSGSTPNEWAEKAAVSGTALSLQLQAQVLNGVGASGGLYLASGVSSWKTHSFSLTGNRPGTT